jgi:hypothetical protein
MNAQPSGGAIWKLAPNASTPIEKIISGSAAKIKCFSVRTDRWKVLAR